MAVGLAWIVVRRCTEWRNGGFLHAVGEQKDNGEAGLLLVPVSSLLRLCHHLVASGTHGCPNCGAADIRVDPAHALTVICNQCGATLHSSTAAEEEQGRRRLVAGVLAAGCTQQQAFSCFAFGGVENTQWYLSKHHFYRIQPEVGQAVENVRVVEERRRQQEMRRRFAETGIAEVSFDGAWSTRGHHALEAFAYLVDCVSGGIVCSDCVGRDALSHSSLGRYTMEQDNSDSVCRRRSKEQKQADRCFVGSARAMEPFLLQRMLQKLQRAAVPISDVVMDEDSGCHRIVRRVMPHVRLHVDRNHGLRSRRDMLLSDLQQLHQKLTHYKRLLRVQQQRNAARRRAQRGAGSAHAVETGDCPEYSPVHGTSATGIDRRKRSSTRSAAQLAEETVVSDLRALEERYGPPTEGKIELPEAVRTKVKMKEWTARFYNNAVRVFDRFHNDVAGAQQELSSAVYHWCGQHDRCSIHCPYHQSGGSGVERAARYTLLPSEDSAVSRELRRIFHTAVDGLIQNADIFVRGLRTNMNECIHSVRSHLAPKTRSFRRSYALRSDDASARINAGHQTPSRTQALLGLLPVEVVQQRGRALDRQREYDRRCKRTEEYRRGRAARREQRTAAARKAALEKARQRKLE